MNSFGFIKRNARQIVVGGALLMVALLPAIAAAAQITERSIALSSSSAGANGVTYEVNFTAATDAGAVVIDFCSNTPLIGQDCTAPAGFSVSSAASATAGYTINAAETTANHIVLDTTIDVSEESLVDFALTGVRNPDDAGSLYARIVTYDTAGNAAANYVSPTDLGEGVVDEGSVAISITPTIGVSGAVLETMTFCVANKAITENCGNAGIPENAPILALGETVGDTVALTTDVSEGSIFTQLSTNAANGAIIRLKSNAAGCGGLLRAGAAPGTCDIAPASPDNGLGINEGEAKFGVKVVAAADPLMEGGSPSGTFRPFGIYNDSTFALNFVQGEETGVTSTYGDPIIDTNNAPINNRNMELVFGAAISNDTPAGLYSADISLIATGKF